MGPDESGQGLVPTLAGFAVVLLLVLLATQVVFALYARSAVTAAALDAARFVADERQSTGFINGDSGSEQAATAAAEARAQRTLGDYGRRTAFDWAFLPSPAQPEQVELRARFDIRHSRYSLLGPLSLPGLSQFDRTVRVRIEHLVCRSGQICVEVAP